MNHTVYQISELYRLQPRWAMLHGSFRSGLFRFQRKCKIDADPLKCKYEYAITLPGHGEFELWNGFHGVVFENATGTWNYDGPWNDAATAALNALYDQARNRPIRSHDESVAARDERQRDYIALKAYFEKAVASG